MLTAIPPTLDINNGKFNVYTSELKCKIVSVLLLRSIEPFWVEFFSLVYKNIKQTLGVGGIAVSIAAFQAVDPGSTPGHRNHIFVKC